MNGTLSAFEAAVLASPARVRDPSKVSLPFPFATRSSAVNTSGQISTFWTTTTTELLQSISPHADHSASSQQP